MKRLGVLFAAALMLVSFGQVKAQKIASLDVAALLSLMPEKKKADEQLEAFSKTKQAEIEKQAKSAQELLKKYQEEAPKQTQAVNEQRNQELQKLQQNIEQMSQTAQKDLSDRMQKAYEPIEKKFYDAVEKVAKANGWDYIFDAASTTFIYKNGPDATAAVKKELGL